MAKYEKLGKYLPQYDIQAVNYADGTTSYECDQHCDNLRSSLKLTVDEIFQLFLV